MFEQSIDIKKPTDAKQLLHLVDMNGFFGNKLEVDDIDVASILNYQYGVEYTKDFNEFCDTMHTALYWINEAYSDMFMVEKSAEALNLCAKIEDLDEDMYRIDIIFGSWLSFVLVDSPTMRKQFLDELSGMTEDIFVDELAARGDDQNMVETFTISWIKKMVDPARAAAYGHYMLYLMLRAAHARAGHDNSIISQVMANLFVFTHTASRLHMMSQHNIPMN